MNITSSASSNPATSTIEAYTPPVSTQRAEAAPAAPATPTATEKAASKERLAAEVKQVNEALKAADDHLQFTVHEATHRIIVKLVDTSTKEILREFPSEKFLNMVVQLQKLSGLQVDVTT